MPLLYKNEIHTMNSITFFSTQPYDKTFFEAANSHKFQLTFLENALHEHTALLVQNSAIVCVFVNDVVNETVVKILAEKGVKIVALRCAGFNNVAIEACKQYGIQVCRVPAYSPESVAEHAVAMMLTLNRKTHKAYNRVREQNFALHGLLGFNMHGKTVGVVGTGNIGIALCKILVGFGCKVLAFDLVANKTLETIGVNYVPLIELLQQSDIVSLHCPLNEQTKYLINEQTIAYLKKGAMLINTSRGGLINTKHVIAALKNGYIGSVGIDVYEQEANIFFKDLSHDIIKDDTIQRLMSFPNVLVTAHQAFFTQEALEQIANTTLQNVNALLLNGTLENKAALVV
jgi:D-lactate dehydrogenase